MKTNGRQSIDSLIKSICDIMRRGSMAGAMQYIPELTWLLFLRILDDTESLEQQESKALRIEFTPSLRAPYRWQDWAAPEGKKRKELTEKAGSALLDFVNDELILHLKSFARKSSATDKQRVISQIFSNLERTAFTEQRDMMDALDKLDELKQDEIDDTHIFTLSQVYENLLLKMGENNNDGGQFFTPREVIRAMVQTVKPKIGERVYDPCCGTGGFLAQANEYIREKRGSRISAEEIGILQQGTFYGREKADAIYPIAIANLVLHGIEVPHIWHGNTLSNIATDSVLYDETDNKPSDVILTNPPFGGKEAKSVQESFDYKTSSTQVLFLQKVIAELKVGGRCGIVVDEGLLFQNNAACVSTKKRLLEKCNVWCIVSLPGGVFSQAGAGVKTNILFFTKGKPTKSVWYYDLSQVKVTRRQPMLLAHFDEFFSLLPKRKDSENSWSVDIETIKANNYDIKAVNPNRKSEVDTRTPKQLLTSISKSQKDLATALVELQKVK